ncbi:MAG: 16S rRNA (cytosine(967)-C(5))-methyltransferase RsmB [Oscillospiraceae bacterium]|nr:16S rRNA (cytosine(967)-C(5))-methyltransferase RsmB [Oscillospiraceae bacterium]
MTESSSRFVVMKLLDKMDKQAYSNIALDSALKDSGLSERDKAFASRLFYGVLERKLTLEHIISEYSSKPLNKLDGSVANVLKMGVYQLLYMDSVPDSAAVNESVALTRQAGKTSASGFVNAVLRSFIRDGKQIRYPDDSYDRMSIEYSCNKDIVKMLCEDYSRDEAEDLLKGSLMPHRPYIRVNTLKTDTDTLINRLNEQGVSAERCIEAEDCILAESLGSVEGSELFKAGMFHVQDLSSQLCCKALDPKPGETVIDICAAPGGKTFTIAEMMGDSGRIIACDLHEKRVGLIKKGAERLGIGSIEAIKNDAKIWNDSLPKADRILCDVPCSGLGVIRSKPELKYTRPEDIKRLPEIQYEILCSAAGYLKEGGELVYSTCTLNRKENDGIVDRFLRENDGFEAAEVMSEYGNKGHKITIFPGRFGCEGFFISKVRKVGR